MFFYESPKYPKSCGFIAATSIKFAGKVEERCVRDMMKTLYSMGWRITSKN